MKVTLPVFDSWKQVSCQYSREMLPESWAVEWESKAMNILLRSIEIPVPQTFKHGTYASIRGEVIHADMRGWSNKGFGLHSFRARRKSSRLKILALRENILINGLEIHR